MQVTRSTPLGVTLSRTEWVTPSRMFLVLPLGFLVGVAVASVYSVVLAWVWVLAVFGVAFVVFAFPLGASFGSKRYLPVALGIMVLGIVFGVVRTQHVLVSLEQESVTRFADETVAVEGVVSRYPDIRVDGARFILDVQSVDGEQAIGRVLVFTDRAVVPNYGDVVTLKGKVRIPEPFDGFNYPRFLAKDGITVTLRARDIERIGESGSVSGRIVASSRAAIDTTTTRILPYREGAILKALLIGDEGSMTDGFKEALNRSGLRHIVAVSGMNITIIVGMAMVTGLAAGLWRRHAFLLAALAISIFVTLIGFPASAVRAAIMGLAMYAAPILGRRGSGFRVSVFAGAVMVAFLPLTLLYDIGFQLSFLAVLGIIFLAPLFMRRLARLPRLLRETFSMTFAAQLAVLPLLLSVFGRVSLVAPLTNLVVVPFLPIVTVWGFLAAVFGTVWLPLGTLVATPLLPYLSVVIWVAEHAAELPIAEATLSGFAAALFASGWYVLLAWVARREAKREPRPIDLVVSVKKHRVLMKK